MAVNYEDRMGSSAALADGVLKHGCGPTGTDQRASRGQKERGEKGQEHDGLREIGSTQERRSQANAVFFSSLNSYEKASLLQSDRQLANFLLKQEVRPAFR